MNFSKGISRKMKTIALSIIAAVLVISVSLGIAYPFLFSASQAAQIKQTGAERYESASDVNYYKQETVNMQIGVEKTLDGLLVYNPDGTVMPAANNHMHFQMAYDYRPYTADGLTSSNTIYTYNYVFDQQAFGAGMLESENTVMYPSDNPIFKITYVPPTVNGVTFGLKITVLKLPATGAGSYQFRYFAHAGNYDVNDNCGYTSHHTADCSDESHGAFDSKYTQFNCNFGLYEIPATIKRQVINLNVTSPTAAVLKTDGVDSNGYIAYSSNGFTQSQYSISQDEAGNGIIINPSIFAKRTNEGAIYSFNSAEALSSKISKIYTRDMTDEVIDTAEFNIADYFNVSYVPYVKNLKSDLLLDDSLTVSVPSSSGDAALLTTGSAINTLFTKDALALKLTKKDGIDIEKLYGRTLFFETKIKKLASAAGDTTLKFKFKIVNEIAQNTASYGDLTADVKTYDLVTDAPLQISVDELMTGTSGKSDRFTILPFSGEKPIGFCTKENSADGTTSCDGSFDLTHGHSVQDKDLINSVDFTTSIPGTATRVTRLDETENKLYIKKKDNFPYQGEMFVVVRVWDIRTNVKYNTCIRVRVIDEGATAKDTADIASTLVNKEKTVPGVTSSGAIDTVNEKTTKPINAVTYDSMLNSGVRYAKVSFDITNYASHLVSNNIITANELRNYSSGISSDHPMIKYGLEITPEDIYKITQPANHVGAPVNKGKFHIDESSLDKVFYLDNATYQKHTDNKQLESEEAYMAWMIDSVDRNLYILPLKSTKYMSALQKNIGMDYIPFGTGADAQDIQLKILKDGETEMTGSGRWLKFNFTIDNVAPEKTSIQDVSTLLKNTLGSDVTKPEQYFPANTIKLISSHDGYNKYKKDVANNNQYNLPQSFILDVYDYINDADVYRFENNGVPTDGEEKAGYDRLRFDITNINSQIPGFQSTSYGNKIEVLGSNDGKKWYTYSQLTSASVNMTKVRYLKFTGKQNIKFITTVVVMDQANRTTIGKFTIDVIDSKPVYEVDGTGLDGFVHEIIKDGASATDLYRDVVHQNFLTLRTFPLDTTGTSYISSYTSWVNANGEGTGLNDFSKVLNGFTNKASLVVNKFVKDPDGEAIKFGTNEDPTTSKKGIPLRIAASGINNSPGADSDVLVVYAFQVGTTAFYEAEIVDSEGTKIFSIRLNLNSDAIEVTALSSYSTAIQVYFPVVSEVDMTDFNDDINSYYCFNLKLLNSKPQVDESKMVGSYVGGNQFKFGNGITFNAGSSISDYVTDVDKADYDSKQLYIMTAASGRNGGYEDNLQVGVEVIKNGATVIEWLNISKVEDSVNMIKFANNKLQFVTEGETLTSGLSVTFKEADGLTVDVVGAVRNKLYVRFYVANFDCNSVTQFLSGNREYSTTQVTYAYTVSGGRVTSKLDTTESGVTTSKRINLLQPMTNSTNKAPDTYYIIGEDKTDDGINDVGYVKIPIDDIANSSSNRGFYFAGHKTNNVSYTQLYRNLISSTGSNQYLSSNGSEDMGYYIKHGGGSVSTSLRADNLPSMVFVVDEVTSKHELWLRPSSRTSDEGFQLRLRLSDAISGESKDESGYGEHTYGSEYSDVTFFFKVQNFDYEVAYNKESDAGTTATFSYQHPTFNLQHTGIDFSMRMGSESDKQLKLYYDTNADADPNNTTEPHARMEATVFSKTLGGIAADVKDYYYISGTSTTEFIVEGVQAMGKPKVNFCTTCNKVVGTGTENTCATHGAGDNIREYYPSVKIIPKQVTGGKKTVSLTVMDFMSSGQNNASIYSGKMWNINLQLDCVDAPEIVNSSAMYPGSKTMTLMDMSGQRVFLTENTDLATVTTPCDRSGDLTYCNPEGKDYVFCDGVSHYKRVNFIKEDFNTAPGVKIHLSDIFNDSDIVKVCRNGKTHADVDSSCENNSCGYVSGDSLVYFPSDSAQLSFSLKTISGETISGTEISFENIKLGQSRVWTLGISGSDKVVEFVLATDQTISIKLLSRSGIEKYDSEGGIRLGVNFRQITNNKTDGAAYNILLQTADNPMITRQKDLDITVDYQTANQDYSTSIPVGWIAYDFNSGDIPTFNRRLSEDSTLNPLIDISYQSEASDGDAGVKIRKYIELEQKNVGQPDKYLTALSFKVLRFHSDTYAKTDVYGNNVYACKPEVQIYRKVSGGGVAPYEGDIRKPKEMRTIRFRVNKNPIKLNKMNSELSYSKVDDKLTKIDTGNSFNIYSSPTISLPDPVYNDSDRKYNIVDIPEQYETTLNKDSTDNKILSGFVVAEFSDRGKYFKEMIYFKKEFQVFLVDASDPDEANWTKSDVTSDGYVTISFNQKAYWYNGENSNNTGTLQGDVKMTITAKKPIIQNANAKLFLRLRVGVQDLYGKTLYQDVDFRTTNSRVTVNKSNQYWQDSNNGITTFSSNLKSAEEAWGSSRPSNETDVLPDGVFDGLSISNMLSDRDMGRFYVSGQATTTYNTYRVKMSINGATKYFIPEDRTPTSVTEPDGSTVQEVNVVYLLRQGADDQTVISDVYDKTVDTRYAVIKMDESGRFKIYPIRSTVGISEEDKRFNFSIVEYEQKKNDEGALTYVRSTSGELNCRITLDIPDSKPTQNNESRTLDVMLGQSTVVDMQKYVFDYDGEQVRISNIDFRENENYIKVGYNVGDSSFTIDVKQKFINAQDQAAGIKNPHFNIKIKVYFTDSMGAEISESCDFTLVYKNNAPTFVSTDNRDPLYHYSVNGTELKIVYQEKERCQAGMTISHNLSSFIRDLDFPGSGSDSNGQGVGEYLNIQLGNDDWKKAYTLREFDDFIINKIAEDSAVFAETSVSFKLRDSSNAYPIYKGGEIINIKIVVVTANTDPMSVLNREKEIADVVRGSHNTISPSGSARYPIATDKNANDKLRFLVAKDEITGEVDPIIEAKYADAEKTKLLYKVEHVQVNGVYDGASIKITVSDDYTEDKINLANIITITDSYEGTLPLNGLVINVTLPPEKALINDSVLTDTTINGLVGYKGIPMKFTTDYAMGTQGGAAEFIGDMMLVDLNKLFADKYVDKITLSSIAEGTGYVVNDKNKTVTINEDYQDKTIAIKAYFAAGGQAPTLMTINCTVAEAKAYTFGMIGVLDEKKDKVDSNKVISINSLITDPHGGEFIFSSVSSSNLDLCTVTYQNNGTELVLTPHKAGVVAITIVVVDKNNPNRFMEKTLEVVLNGYPVVSVFDMIFGNVWYVIAIALGIVIVLTVIIVIIVKARKKKKLMKELETMLLAEMDAEEQLKLSGGNDMLMLGSGMMPNNMLLGAGQMQNNPMMYLNAGQGSQMMGQGYGQSQMYDPNQFGGQSQMNNQGYGQSQMMGQPGYGQSQMYDPNQFAGQSQMMNQGYGSQMMNQGYGNSQMYDPNQFGGQSQMNNQGYGQQPQQGYGQQQQGGAPGGDGFFDLNDYNNFNR